MRRPRLRFGTRRSIARVVSVAVLAMVIAGCSDTDSPTPMTIVNRTTGPVDVVLHETLKQRCLTRRLPS